VIHCPHISALIEGHTRSATIGTHVLAVPQPANDPGPLYYAQWVVGVAVIIGIVYYAVRFVRKRRSRGGSV
jgi:hypothetical protein